MNNRTLELVDIQWPKTNWAEIDPILPWSVTEQENKTLKRLSIDILSTYILRSRQTPHCQYKATVILTLKSAACIT